MSAPQCFTCRWWNGNKDSYTPASSNERVKHGYCTHIVSSYALPDDWPVRLVPIGTGASVRTRYDFSCRCWESEWQQGGDV